MGLHYLMPQSMIHDVTPQILPCVLHFHMLYSSSPMLCYVVQFHAFVQFQFNVICVPLPQDQEQDFKLQNQTLMQELGKVSEPFVRAGGGGGGNCVIGRCGHLWLPHLPSLFLASLLFSPPSSTSPSPPPRCVKRTRC